MSRIHVATESAAGLAQGTPDGLSAKPDSNDQLTDQELIAPFEARSTTGSHRCIASVSFSSWR